jgi:polysulfide reductase chain C
MDAFWGNTAQYSEIAFTWPIALYLLLAGLSAGSLMTSLLVKWIEGNDTPPWDGLIKAGAILAFPVILIGLFLLIIDLGKPFSFYLLLFNYNLASVMSIGVLLLLVYMPLALIFPMVIFQKYILESRWARKRKRLIASLIQGFEKGGVWLEGFIFFISFGVAIYTGFLLSAVVATPLLNVAVIPILFLVSSLSAGIAADILVGLTLFEDTVEEKNLKYLLALDLRVIPAELFLLVLLFIGLYFHGGAYALVAKQALTVGVWAKLFWVGVVGIGLVLPVIIAINALHGHAYKLRTVLLNSSIVLAGVLFLRFYLLYAGQIFVG